MSLKKSATRRLSLLAGSSLAAATIAATAFAAAALAPAVAFAADECTPVAPTLGNGPGPVSDDPTLNGGLADRFACTGATLYQPSGITYASQGNLTVNSTGAMDVGAVGINLTGNNADTVTFTATGTLTGSSGVVLDITTASGAITATTTGLTATAPGATGAIRLESTGAGNITYTRTGTNAASAINNDTPGGGAAVTAISHGGNISLTIPTGGQSPVRGYSRGIVAETSGTGSVVITSTGSGGIRTNLADGIAGVDVTAGSGGIILTLGAVNAGYGTPPNQPHGAGTAILATTTGSINITTTNLVAGGTDGIVANSGGALNITTSHTIRAATGDAIRGVSTAGATITNTGTIGNLPTAFSPSAGGKIDLSGVSGGGVTFSNSGSGVWLASGASVFTAQNDILSMAGTGRNQMATDASIDFGSGVDTVQMSGILGADNAVITNLETFNNSGTIYLGELVDEVVGNDLLSMVGTTFTGTGSSRLIVDVVLGGVGQVGCETLTGAAGCLDLRDGTTAGSTIITITDASPGAMISAYLPEGITIVDVAGSGTSAAEHFTLDPSSTGGYVHPIYGPAFDRPGAFVYLFRYDAENQRHVLISQPKSRDLFDYAILSGAAHSIWHMTAQAVTDRQTELRDRTEVDGLWFRSTGEVTRRDVTTAFDGFDGPISFDNGYNLYSGTITGGADVFSGSSGEFDYVLGGQIGYVSSSLEMDQSDSTGRFTGATGGLYGSLWSNWFFLDTALNINGLALDFEHRALESKTTTFVNSVGASAEAGTRTMLTQNTFAEPMAAVSWVRTTFEEISLREGEVQPADAQSVRAGLGMRLGATLPGESVNASYFVAGRGWYEFDGESEGVVHTLGADLPFADEFTGAFGEAEVGVNVFNTANTLSGFVSSGVKWKGDYSAVNLSLGVRMAW